MEFVPQREFATATEPVNPAPKSAEKPIQTPQITKASQAAQTVPAPEPVKEQKPDTSGQENAHTSGYTKLEGITQPEWEQLIEKVPSPLYAAMLEGSNATVNGDGVLEIHSGNLMLQGMTSNGCEELEKELSGAFGKKVRARVVGEEQETAEEDKDLPVKELLEKARRLNIEVDIK